jgi:aminopeptidase
MRADLCGRLADLAVEVGANVQPDQIVSVTGHFGQEEMMRAIAERAYRRGARFVDVRYFDSRLKRVRAEQADPATLDFVPPWYGERVLELDRQRCALIGLAPRLEPGVLDGLDPVLAGRDRLPTVKESTEVVNARGINWTAIPSPTEAWARLVYPELASDEAVDRLWQEVAAACRADADDPRAAWRARMGELRRVAGCLAEARLDAIHFLGPETDLTVGLLPSSTWITADFATHDGIPHFVNIPSEETFTTPDPERAEGVVRSTRPLAIGGTVVRGLRVRFERGRAVSVEADSGGEALRSWTTLPGGDRLGELALVDRESRVGALGTTFLETLLDENAASHLAFGSAYSFGAGDSDRARINESVIHVDFMIGGEDVAVTGVARDGTRIPLLREGAWQI